MVKPLEYSHSKLSSMIFIRVTGLEIQAMQEIIEIKLPWEQKTFIGLSATGCLTKINMHVTIECDFETREVSTMLCIRRHASSADPISSWHYN